MSRYAGLVPSAGASERMGRPKPLLTIRDSTFVERAVRALTEGGCDPVLVVVATGDEPTAKVASDAGARVLTNADPGEGPITSLRLALEIVGEDAAGLVYLPVDHPLVRPSTVSQLLDAARESGAPVTLPVLGTERGHPAVFAASLFAELVDPRLEGGARTVTHRHLAAARLVEVDDPGVLADIDTPELYERVVGVRLPPGEAR